MPSFTLPFAVAVVVLTIFVACLFASMHGLFSASSLAYLANTARSWSYNLVLYSWIVQVLLVLLAWRLRLLQGVPVHHSVALEVVQKKEEWIEPGQTDAELRGDSIRLPASPGSPRLPKAPGLSPLSPKAPGLSPLSPTSPTADKELKKKNEERARRGLPALSPTNRPSTTAPAATAAGQATSAQITIQIAPTSADLPKAPNRPSVQAIAAPVEEMKAPAPKSPAPPPPEEDENPAPLAPAPPPEEEDADENPPLRTPVPPPEDEEESSPTLPSGSPPALPSAPEEEEE